MGFADAAGGPVCAVVNGTTHTFRALKIRELAGLLARWAAEDRAALLRDLEDGKADPPERTKQLRELSNETALVSYGVRAAFRLDRAMQTVAASVGTEDAVEVMGLPPDVLVNVACKLWGFDMAKVAKAPKQEEGDADPTGGQPATGT